MHGRVDSKRLRLGGLTWIWVDPDQVTWAGVLQHDPREQAVATPEVEASALGQSCFQQLVDLDRAPEGGRGLERVLVQKAREQLPVQAGTSASALSTSPRLGRLSRYTWYRVLAASRLSAPVGPAGGPLGMSSIAVRYSGE
jgi:hypothetical protein